VNAVEVARRLAHARSGAALVAYREVALPLFRIDCELLVLESKDVPPIQEFVLRTVNAGLCEPTDIAGLLGIDEDVVLRAAAELLHIDALVLAPDDESRTNRLRLTRKGRQAALDAAQVQAVEVDVPVWIDGLTREVLSVSGRKLSAFRASQASDRGLVEIPAFPRKRPGLENVPFESVRAVFAEEGLGRRLRREVIGITGLGTARRYAREAVALAYHAPGEPEPVVHLAVDGEISEKHDVAYARARERSARRISPEHWVPAAEVLRDEVVPSVLDQATDADDLERAEASQANQSDELRGAVAVAPPDRLGDLEKQLAESEARERELRASLETISVRQVQVYEHRGYLERALSEAQSRVMIVSPWIRHEVVDDEFVTRLRRVVERGIELWIGYGIVKSGGDRPGAKGAADRDAVAKLRRLATDYPKLCRLRRLGDTHAKVLICDSRFSVITSFNWLSFRGDAQLDFRDERGYYVGLREKVDEVFETYRARFAEDAPPG
jgi:hypothetical protein